MERQRGCIACARKREQDRQLRTNPPIAMAFCAICINGTTELRRRHLEPGGAVFVICIECDEQDPKTLISDPPRRPVPPKNPGRGGGWQRKCYEPIDETNRRIVFRILAAMRHFDWVTARHLSEVVLQIWAEG